MLGSLWQLENNEENRQIDTGRPTRVKKIPDRYGEWVYTCAEDDPSNPNTYAEAMRNDNREKWQDAMEEEMKSLSSLKVWELVPLPEGRKAVGSVGV